MVNRLRCRYKIWSKHFVYKIFKSFVDEILKPVITPVVKPVDHSILLDELAILREKYLFGTPSDEHKFAGAVITAAMAVIIGI